MIKLYTDAATKGNFGVGGIGVLIVANHRQTQLHWPLPAMSNHAAEFEAALAGLRYLRDHGETGSVILYSDSKIVIDSLEKQYAKHYSAYVAQLQEATAGFSLVLWEWLPDRANQGAHALAQQGLKEAMQTG